MKADTLDHLFLVLIVVITYRKWHDDVFKDFLYLFDPIPKVCVSHLLRLFAVDAAPFGLESFYL